MRHTKKYMFNKLYIFLIAVFITIPLFSFNAYAEENIGDTITDIRFGTNESDNNFKYYHGVFRTDNNYKLTKGNYDNLTNIESKNPKDSVSYWLQYNYDLIKHRLALKKGDVKIDIYTNSDSWYKDRTALKDQYERPQFEVYYGYNDDKWDVKDEKFSKDSGTSNSGAEFRWNNPNENGEPSPLPSNLRYIRINFDTEDQNAGGEGFAATYDNMHLYFIDNADPQIEKVSSSASNSGTLSIGDIVYINVDFDEAVTINNDSKIKLNIVDINGNPVYASYVWDGDEEFDSYYRVKYKYIIEEGDYIPDSDSRGYVFANINNQDRFAYVYLNNQYNYYIYDLGHRMYFANEDENTISKDFNTNIKVDGTKPIVTNVEFCSDTNSQYYTKDNKYYKKGDNIYFKVTFNDNVYYSSSSVKLNLTENRYATYRSGNGTNEIVFRYTVEDKSLNYPDDPIDIIANNLFNSGYLKDINGNESYETTGISLYDMWVRIDNTLPIINVNYDENDIYKKTHRVYVEASDDNSLISEIKYIWKEASDNSVINWDQSNTCVSGQIIRNPKDVSGEYKLFIRAKDYSGNISVYETETFNIDNNPPEVIITPNGGNITSLDSMIDISGTDDYSNLNTYFQFVKVDKEDEEPGYNDTLWREYKEKFKLHENGALEDGTYRLYVKAVDELGNERIIISKAFIVGDNAMLTIKPSGSDEYKQSYDIEVLSEEESGISYRFSTNPVMDIDSELWNGPVEGDRLSFTGFTGKAYEGIVYLHVKTTVDGKDYYKRSSFLFDKTSPVLEIEPLTLTKDKPINYAAVKINIEDISRVKLYSKWDDEAEWTEEESNVISRDNGEGYHTLQIKAIDEAGNITIQDKILENEEMIEVGYYIDNISPSGDILETITTTSGVINVTQSAIDGLTNTEDLKYCYSINDGLTWNPWTDYTDNFDVKVTTTGSIDLAIKYRDEAGNESDIYNEQVEVETIDDGINITYDKEQYIMTNEPITATINIPQEIIDEGYVIVNNEGKNTYEFSDNGIFKFILENSDKENIEITASVNNIDLEKPKVITKAFSTTMSTNKNVSMTIVTDEPVVFDSQLVSMIDTKGYQHEYIFNENDSVTLDFKDKAGNKNSVDADVDWIDLDPPHIAHSLDVEEITESNVTVTIESDEDIRILNNYGLNHRTFTENGEFTFEVEDLAGNKSEYVVNVNNINRNIPNLWIEYSTESVTNGAVIATVNADIEIEVLNNDGNNTYTFDKNGVFTFVVKDLEKNIMYDVDAVVTNIDNKAPEIAFEGYDNRVFGVGGSYLLDDYILTDNMDENLENQIEIDEAEFNINEPGTYTIKYKFWDDAGNKAEYLREVEVVDYDNFSIYINGVKINDKEQIVLEDDKALIQVFTYGKYDIYGKDGRYKQNQLKSGSEKINNNTIMVNEEGWYSVYILDQERNTKYIRIYFIP